MTGEGKKRAAVFSVVLFVAATGSAANDGFDPFVPVVYRSAGLEPTLETLRQVRATTGLRRFFLAGPGFNDVMFRPFSDDLYAGIGRDVAEARKALADTDIEIGWWCTPSIRYF